MIDYQNLNKSVPVIQLYLFNIQYNLLIKTNLLNTIITMFKTHLKYQFKILTCISGSDYPENYYRFNILYELLSIKYNIRLRIKVIVDEITSINSIENVFMAADWWENEVWDMFGVFF